MQPAIELAERCPGGLRRRNDLECPVAAAKPLSNPQQALTLVVSAQRRVDPRNSYTRVIAVVPLTGSGTAADPKRPKYAPWPASPNTSGIIGFIFEPTDDGKSAVVEFVAQNRAAFSVLLADKTIEVFQKGAVSKSAIETAIKQVRRDFSLDSFGMVMP
jgi:hypothetical protein